MNREMEQLIITAAEHGASDIHIAVGHYPTLRISGDLIPLSNLEVTTPQKTEELTLSLLNDDQKQRFLKYHDLDFAFSFQEKLRIRANAYWQQGYHGAALRLIPYKIKTIEELNLPKTLHEFTRHSQGFVIVTGPTGHGKSTTLAALIDEINQKRPEHIVTIEDPIEYVFSSGRAIVDQREVGSDALSFRRALRASFRQDADVIMLGEMRDRDTISTAVTAAETGHLVFATLHTNSASQTIHRIIDIFPADQQEQIRLQLASALLGVVSQRLVPRSSGGLIPAVEVLLANYAVRNLIRENKMHQIDLVVQTSMESGMVSLNHSLANLVGRGEITLQTAELYSLNPSELAQLVNQ